jgi:hypothetical protein
MLRQRPWTSLGVGVVGVVAFGVLMFLVVLVAVLLSIGLGLVGLSDLVGAIIFAALATLLVLAFLFFLIAVFGAPAWVGMAVAGLVVGLDSTSRRWAALVIGLVIVVALTSIPLVGGWIGLVVLFFGLGAAILAFRPRRAAGLAEPPAAAPSV